MRKNLLWALAAAVSISLAGCSCNSEEGNGGREEEANEEKKSLDASFIPEDCFFAMVIHPRRIADSPLAKELSEDVTEEMLRWFRGKGPDYRKMEEVVVLGLPREPTGTRYGPPFDGGFIIRFSEAIADREFKKMFWYLDFADEQATHAGKEYYRGWFPYMEDLEEGLEDLEEPRDPDEPADLAVDEEPRDPNGPADVAVHLADDRTMAFSYNEAILKKMLSADEVKSELVERLGQLDDDNDLIAVVTVEGSGEVFDKLAEELDRELPPGMRGLLKAPELGSAATLTADLRADPVAELIVEANDADSAAKLKKVVESAIIVGESLFDERNEIVRESPPGVGRPLVELIEQTFDAVTVTEDGEKVTATLKRPETLAKLPVIITIAAEHQLEQLRRRDFDAIEGLCQRARRDWVEKRFAQLELSVWKDQFVHYSVDYETGQPVIGTFDTIARISQNLTEAFDEIAPHPASTQFEIQRPVAVVRLPLAKCRKGEQTSFADFLAIAARQDRRWKIAAAVLGDWKLTEADRFDPQNEDHQALQAFYDRINQGFVDEDADGLRDVCHPLWRGIWPGAETDKLESAVIVDREGVVSSFQDLWQQSDFQKHHHKIVFAKVTGPLALTLAEASQIVDDGPEEKWKCLQFFCRDGDQWKACLWMPGDWEKMFMAE